MLKTVETLTHTHTHTNGLVNNMIIKNITELSL